MPERPEQPARRPDASERPAHSRRKPFGFIAHSVTRNTRIVESTQPALSTRCGSGPNRSGLRRALPQQGEAPAGKQCGHLPKSHALQSAEGEWGLLDHLAIGFALPSISAGQVGKLQPNRTGGTARPVRPFPIPADSSGRSSGRRQWQVVEGDGQAVPASGALCPLRMIRIRGAPGKGHALQCRLEQIGRGYHFF
jgi:hypothetical protein